jgi:KDO2-lipid IV(A) lauroyltransferase
MYLLDTVFACLPLDMASDFGGWIGRTVGMRLGVTKRAYKHLEIAFPDLTPDHKKEIILGMWDNLGRVIAEYPHLETIAKTRVRIINADIIKNALAQGKGGIFISSHNANWETHVPTLLDISGVTASLTYRPLNNPYADAILRKRRTLKGKIPAYPKSRASGRLLLRDLKSKKYLAILIDQKYNEGVPAPFFGRPAMTNPVFAQLAQKYKCPVIPSQCKRLKGANFEITIHKPLKLFDKAGASLPLETVLNDANSLIEQWITDAPEQWLWLHRRWKSKNLADA